MLCPTCGEKVRVKEGKFICRACDSEFDRMDVFEMLIPEPVFVAIRLDSECAIIDTRQQKLYLRLDTMEKAELITGLLNKNLSQSVLKKQADKYFGH